MPPRPYRLEFYEDEKGDSPVERWFESLAVQEAYVLGSAMDGLLQQSGPLLCTLRPQYAKALGDGLYEFRLQDLSADLLVQLGKKPRHELLKALPKMLFRVFFHVHGEKVILLLAGYDKAKNPSPTFQNKQIQLARKRLASWQARSRRGRKRQP